MGKEYTMLIYCRHCNNTKLDEKAEAFDYFHRTSVNLKNPKNMQRYKQAE